MDGVPFRWRPPLVPMPARRWRRRGLQPARRKAVPPRPCVCMSSMLWIGVREPVREPAISRHQEIAKDPHSVRRHNEPTRPVPRQAAKYALADLWSPVQSGRGGTGAVDHSVARIPAPSKPRVSASRKKVEFAVTNSAPTQWKVLKSTVANGFSAVTNAYISSPMGIPLSVRGSRQPASMHPGGIAGPRRRRGEAGEGDRPLAGPKPLPRSAGVRSRDALNRGRRRRGKCGGLAGLGCISPLSGCRMRGHAQHHRRQQ
jgi:hypothetical protein